MAYYKTYGIFGLLEWHGYVTSGTTRMKVSFTNGSTSAWGVAPATFTTKDALTQHIIENSDQFKGGRIRLVRSVAIAEPTKPQSAKPQAPNGETKQLSFSYNDEAKDYLVENFGAERAKIMTRRQIEDFAKSKGIEITWKEK
jgi:hypothetical protein